MQLRALNAPHSSVGPISPSPVIHHSRQLTQMLPTKWLFGFVNVNFDNFFALSTNTNTRGHKYKLFKPRRTASTRQKFFVDRVINVWNALPSTTNFASLNVFKNSIEKVDFSSFSCL